MYDKFLNINDPKDYLKYIFILFFIIFIINISNLTLRNIFSLFIGMIIIGILIYYNIYKKNTKNYLIKTIKTEIPKLKPIHDIDILLFYYNNIQFMKYDVVNFNNSIRNIIEFIKIYNKIKEYSELRYYQYDIMMKYMYLSIKYFQNMELNIPHNDDSLKNQIITLKQILHKYINEIKSYFDKSYNVLYKNHNQEITPYNKFFYY